MASMVGSRAISAFLPESPLSYNNNDYLIYKIYRALANSPSAATDPRVEWSCDLIIRVILDKEAISMTGSRTAERDVPALYHIDLISVDAWSIF